METMRHHRSPRWLNARMRLARLTIPQWLAIAAAGAAGVGLYLALAQVPLPRPLAGSAFYLRLVLVGPPSGLLGVLLYALADDRREPFIRQAVFYLFRRHHYEEGAPRVRTRLPRSPGRAYAGLIALARARARLRSRRHRCPGYRRRPCPSAPGMLSSRGNDVGRHMEAKTRHEERDRDMTATMLGGLKRWGAARLTALSRQHRQWTRPLPQTLLGGTIADAAETKRALLAENALLRQQLIVLRRQVKQPTLTPGDRMRLVLLARLARTWQAAFLIVQPQTLLRWHRQGYRLLWRARSKAARKRPQIAPETVALIERMAGENRLWGAERIRGELLKLGLRASKRTVQRYMRDVRPPRRSGQTWAAFLATHAHEIWACDFLPVVDVGFRTLYAFFIVELGSRRVVHVGVTRQPTDAWVAPQLREATPFGTRPRFLIRDNDSKFGEQFAHVAATTAIEILRTPSSGAARERHRRVVPG